MQLVPSPGIKLGVFILLGSDPNYTAQQINFSVFEATDIGVAHCRDCSGLLRQDLYHENHYISYHMCLLLSQVILLSSVAMESAI